MERVESEEKRDKMLGKGWGAMTSLFGYLSFYLLFSNVRWDKKKLDLPLKGKKKTRSVSW